MTRFAMPFEERDRSIDRANRASRIRSTREKRISFAPRPLFIPSKNQKIHRVKNVFPFDPSSRLL